MSLVATCWWTLVRTVVLCLLAWPVCRWIERSCHSLPYRGKTWLLIALMAPCCFPELLVGYAFRDLALAYPGWAEALCSSQLFVRMIPIGTVALLAAPAPRIDASAIYCRQLAQASQTDWAHRFELARCYWHGPIVRTLPALALMSIVAFQEFEMAALLQTMSWTDWFVTAQRLGTDQRNLLQLSIYPLLWQLPVLLGVIYWLQMSTARSDSTANRDGAMQTCSIRPNFGPGLISTIVLVIAGCLIPLLLIGRRTFDGLEALLHQRMLLIGLAREIAIAGAIAITAGLAAWGISVRLRGLSANLHIFGLFGSLLLSLASVALFQTPWLRPFYDTPIPWVLTLVIWLLPRAAILQLWMEAFRNDDAIHVSMMLQPRDRRSLVWQLRDQPQFLAVCLLCFWAYCDLPTAYLLAPTGMISGIVRLYNFMHFGRSAALSAEAAVFFGVPACAIGLLLLVKRRFQ
jgi:hypothetical protein